MFDLDDYVMGREDGSRGSSRRLGVTHSLSLGSDPNEVGRLYIDTWTRTEHWILRPGFDIPAPGALDVVLHVRSTTESLDELFDWARLVTGSRYVRAKGEELAVPEASAGE
jgi:hypothetical protein